MYMAKAASVYTFLKWAALAQMQQFTKYSKNTYT